MFPYDAQLAATVAVPPDSMQVTSAVEALVNAGGFADAQWLAELDVQFGRLFFSALHAALSGGQCPGCWRILFASRNKSRIARLQFAMAGITTFAGKALLSRVP